jgi:hypothetical protein
MFFLPAMSRPAFDNVKIAVEVDENNARFYFGRCVAFLKDDDDNVFVAVRWYSEVPGTILDPVVKLVPLTLAPDTRPESYSIMPEHTILNGALIVPRKDLYWAMLSPREEKQYLLQNST